MPPVLTGGYLLSLLCQNTRLLTSFISLCDTLVSAQMHTYYRTGSMPALYRFALRFGLSFWSRRGLRWSRLDWPAIIGPERLFGAIGFYRTRSPEIVPRLTTVTAC